MTPPFSWADGGQVPATLSQLGPIWVPTLADRNGAPLGAVQSWQSIEVKRQLNVPTIVDVEWDMDDPMYTNLLATSAPRLKLYDLRAAGFLRFNGHQMPDTIEEDAGAGISKMSFGDPRIQWADLYIPSPSGPSFIPSQTVNAIFALVMSQITATSTGLGSMVRGQRTMTNAGGASTALMGSTGQIQRGRSVADVVAELCDLGIDVDCIAVDGYLAFPPVNVLSWTMGQRTTYDQQGSDKPTVRFTFVDNTIDGLPGGMDSNVENMKRTWTKPYTAGVNTGTDNDTGVSQIQTFVDATTADIYERTETWESSPEGMNTAQMLARATLRVNASKVPLPVLEVINPVRTAPQPFIDYNLGDTVYVSCVVKGISLFNQPYRVHGFSFKTNSEGNFINTKLTLAPV